MLGTQFSIFDGGETSNRPRILSQDKLVNRPRILSQDKLVNRPRILSQDKLVNFTLK